MDFESDFLLLPRGLSIFYNRRTRRFTRRDMPGKPAVAFGRRQAKLLSLSTVRVDPGKRLQSPDVIYVLSFLD